MDICKERHNYETTREEIYSRHFIENVSDCMANQL